MNQHRQQPITTKTATEPLFHADLHLAAERFGVSFGMEFLDAASIRAHRSAAGAAKKAELARNGTLVKRLAALVAASAPRPA